MIRQLTGVAEATADLLVALAGADLCRVGQWSNAGIGVLTCVLGRVQLLHQHKPQLCAATWERPSSSNIAYAQGVKWPRADQCHCF